MIKGRDKVKRKFNESGISIAEWARENGFNVNLVYQVLRGDSKALRGQAHDIACRLGIKRGTEREPARAHLTV